MLKKWNFSQATSCLYKQRSTSAAKPSGYTGGFRGLTLSKMSSEQSGGNYGERIWTKLADYRHIRHQRYAAVNVLLISWKDDDTNGAAEIKQLKTLFQDSFNYTVCSYQIPSANSQASLNYQTASFLMAFGGPDNLLVIYYGGHGGPRTQQSKSPCTWAA